MHSRAAAPAIPIAPIIIVEPALEEGERVVPAWQSEVIRGHQRSSEAIRKVRGLYLRGNPWQSVAIRGHQRSSALISAHQWQSEVISGHQWSSEVIRGHQWSSPPKGKDAIVETSSALERRELGLEHLPN